MAGNWTVIPDYDEQSSRSFCLNRIEYVCVVVKQVKCLKHDLVCTDISKCKNCENDGSNNSDDEFESVDSDIEDV